MKVYDGAGLIADKTGAMVVPVRIDGLEQTPFSRLSREQVRRRLFPKVKVTVLEPVKLDGRSGAEGQAAPRRPRARRSTRSCRISSSAPADIDRTVFAAIIEAADRHGMGRSRSRIRSPARSPTRSLLAGAAVLGAKLDAATPTTASRSASCCPTPTAPRVTFLGLMSAAGCRR